MILIVASLTATFVILPQDNIIVKASSPTVSTNATTSITTTTATLNGYLSNDGGENCSGWFEWGETDSYGNTVYILEDDTEDSFSSSGDPPNSGSLANMHDEDWGTSGGLNYEADDDAGEKTITVYEEYDSVPLVDKFGVTVKFAQWVVSGAGSTVHDFEFFIYNLTSSEWESKVQSSYGNNVYIEAFGILNASHYINTTNNNQVKTKVYMRTVSDDNFILPKSGHVEYYESKLTSFIPTETSFNATLTGLDPGTTYHYRAVANNSDGTSYGSDMTFTTGGLLSVSTNASSNVDADSATLNGYLSDDGGEGCIVSFEYGLTDSYGSTVYPYQPDLSSGEHTIDSGSINAQSMYACDVDSDGDIDVLSASYSDGYITWYENDGSESFTQHIIADDFSYARSVYAIDIDSDGDIDVLGVSYSAGEITWWENDGSEGFTEHTINGSFNGAWDVYACDVDSDDDIDVLGAALAGEITWFENDGSESFTKHTINDSFEEAYDVYATDVDGDSDIDVLGAAYSGDDITWWENDGSESFTEHTIDGSFDGAYEVYACDVDGDNDIDVLGAAYSDGEITWWENDGSESFTKHTIDASFDGARSVYACDIDGDGDIDVLGAAFSADDITWWENDGSESFTEHTIEGNFNGAQGVYATDVDGDDDIDVLGAAYFDDEIVWWENNQSKNSPLEFSYSLTGISPSTTYHYRAVANNSVGESYGSDMTFTTPEFSINGLDANTRFPFSGSPGTTVWSTGNITMNIHTNLSGTSLSCTDIYLDFKDGIDTDINQNQFSIAVINTSDGSWASVSSVLDVTGNMTIDSTTWASGLSAGWAHGTNPFPIDDVNTTIAVRARVSIPAGKDLGTYTADDWEVTWDY